METQAVTGLVIKEKKVSEADRLCWILTDKVGVIKAFVPNALNINSKFLSATQLLSYSKLHIKQSKKDETYRISDAKPINVFWKLRQNIEALSLCGYMCELLLTLAPSDEEAGDFLSIALNSAFALSENLVDRRIVKAVFELKFCSLAGYMPDLFGCSVCGEENLNSAVFNVSEGVLLCGNCGNDGVKIGSGTLQAMRHIILSDGKKAFSFKLKDDSLNKLCEVCEKFVLSQTDRQFKTLQFYKEL